jgi:hypothetical protein
LVSVDGEILGKRRGSKKNKAKVEAKVKNNK